MSLFTSLNDFTRLAWCPKLSGRITLYKEGEPLIGSEITNWASANGWQPKHAKELGALAEKIGSGGRVVIKNKGMLRPNIIEILKEKVATNA